MQVVKVQRSVAVAIFHFAAIVCAWLLLCLPAAGTSLVTGNGFGLAVVSPDTGTLTKFYAHPYSLSAPDPANPLSEGIETASFFKSLSWGNDAPQNTSVEYLDDSQVIQARKGAAEGFFFMPFGWQQAVLIVGWEPDETSHGNFRVEWNRPITFQKVIRKSGIEMQLLRFDGIRESLLLVPLGQKRAAPAGSPPYLSTSLGWAFISLEEEGELEAKVRGFLRWQSGLSPKALARREVAEVGRWRVKSRAPLAGETERRLWRQSEVVLRMAQSREPNRPGRHNNGLILASLPEGPWFTPWVRDMAYATVALARMGHCAESRAAILAYFNAQPTGKMRAETAGADYQISVVRYFGDGSEEPFFTLEGSTNIEFDNWGLVLWTLGEYQQNCQDPGLLRTPTYRGQFYDSAKDYVVKPLIANLEKFPLSQ